MEGMPVPKHKDALRPRVQETYLAAWANIIHSLRSDCGHLCASKEAAPYKIVGQVPLHDEPVVRHPCCTPAKLKLHVQHQRTVTIPEDS